MTSLHQNQDLLSISISYNNTDHDGSHYTGYYNNSDWTYPQDFCWYYEDNISILTWIIVCTSLPLTPLAIFLLWIQVRNDHVGPIYIINLHISDLVQLSCMIVHMSDADHYSLMMDIFVHYVYPCGVMASVSFMVCISMERYLVVAYPLWYQFRRTMKISVGVSVMVWVISIFVGLFHNNFLGAFLILPLPLLIFFLVGTVKALSAVSSVPSDEKRRIVAVLVVVLLIYVLVFVPRIIMNIFYLADIDIYTWYSVYDTTCSLVQLNPLTDLILYFFIKKWVRDKVLARLCCRGMDTDDISKSAA